MLSVTSAAAGLEIGKFAMDEVKEEEDEIKVEILEDDTHCEETNMMCDLCPAVCKSVRALQKHKQVKHEACICPECGISIEGMDKLRYHKSQNCQLQITNHKLHSGITGRVTEPSNARFVTRNLVSVRGVVT